MRELEILLELPHTMEELGELIVLIWCSITIMGSQQRLYITRDYANFLIRHMSLGDECFIGTSVQSFVVLELVGVEEMPLSFALLSLYFVGYFIELLNAFLRVYHYVS